MARDVCDGILFSSAVVCCLGLVLGLPGESGHRIGFFEPGNSPSKARRVSVGLDGAFLFAKRG